MIRTIGLGNSISSKLRNSFLPSTLINPFQAKIHLMLQQQRTNQCGQNILVYGDADYCLRSLKKATLMTKAD